ncbi:RNA polymerase sigma-70 factor [Parapedobacter pyrenivorans]|uniref:RNA polymerase sigma-70 factor n=1 Tax=Parapedobacter pyrenivorans TaxID=1305674 RepID=UPI00333E1E30
MNDLGLFEKIRNGDFAAFETLFITYYAALCEYASQFVSEDDAEELVQELMIYLWESRNQLVVATSLKSYLFVAVKNRAYNALRKQKYREKAHSRLADYLDDQYIDDPDLYTMGKLAAQIAEAINTLPESYRETFQLSRFEGMTNAQVASALNVSVKTIEYRITRSLKILRAKLKDYVGVVLFLF